MADEERKALEQVRATLSTLTPTTPRDDAIAFDLRYASRHLAGAQAKSGAVAVSLDRRTLTQEMIDTARLAVAAVLDQIQPVAEAIS